MPKKSAKAYEILRWIRRLTTRLAPAARSDLAALRLFRNEEAPRLTDLEAPRPAAAQVAANVAHAPGRRTQPKLVD